MSLVEYVDLSHTLDERTQMYPGDPSFRCCPLLTIEHDGNNVASISMGSHTGTHVDAPYHFVQCGERIDEVPLPRFIGPAVVVDLSSKTAGEPIVWNDLAPYEETLKRRVLENPDVVLLLRADWSRHWGSDAYFEHPYLVREAAEGIIATGIRTIGIDTPSPDVTHVDPGAESDFAAHQIILGAGGIIAENLTNLQAIQDGDWVGNLVPLKIGGCDTCACVRLEADVCRSFRRVW